MPSNSKLFLIPKTKCMFSCISEAKINTLNLCPCISITIGIMNNMLINCPVPTWNWEANFGNECKDLHHK